MYTQFNKSKTALPRKSSHSSFDLKDELTIKIQELYDEEFDDVSSSLLHIDIDSYLLFATKRIEGQVAQLFAKADISTKDISALLQLNQLKLKKTFLNQYEDFSKQWRLYVAKAKSFNELTHYRKHCSKTSQYAYHKCKTSSQYCISRFIEVSLNEKDVTHVICIKCQEIYPSKEMKLYCSNCNVNYYSSVLSKTDMNDLLPATWKSYHCKRQINERMKCIKCFHVLYLDLNTLKLYCINPRCLFVDDPMSIIWKCTICQSDFQSEATIFNPMENLVYQKAIKSALLNKVKAKPLYDCCDLSECGKEESSYRHGKRCCGLLYSGEVNNKKMIACERCKAIYLYSAFIWRCPLCDRKFSMKNTNKYSIENPIEVCFDKCKSNKGTNPFGMISLLPENFSEKHKGQKTHQPFTINNLINKSERNSIGAADETKSPSPEEELIKKSPDNNYNNMFEDNDDNLNIIVKEDPDEDYEEEGYYEYLRRVNQVVQSNDNIEEILNDEIIPSFNLEEYQTIKKIGQGSYANIYDILHTESGKHFAMKKIITHEVEEVRKYKTEFELVYSNPHPHIVKIYYMSIRKLDFGTYSISVIMELAESDWDTQIKYYQNINKEYSEEDLLMILYQLASALSFLQSKGFSHRDIKPQNVLLFPMNIYKISDFGEAKSIKKAKNLNTLKGTEMFMSPSLFKALHLNEGEVIHNSYKSDVYSLGLCFLYAITFNFSIINALRMDQDSNVLLKELNLSSDLTKLISKMISRSERERFDFVSLMESLSIFDN